MLVKAANNSYSDRQIVKIAMNIIRNKNYSEKGQAKWYGKIPGKQTWEDLRTHFEASLRQLKKYEGIPCEAQLTTNQNLSKQIQPITSYDISIK